MEEAPAQAREDERRAPRQAVLLDALESWPHAFVVLDRERRRVLALNRRFEALFGLSERAASALTGASVDTLLAACAGAALAPQALRAALEQGATAQSIALKRGAFVDSTQYALPDAHLVLFEDVTERLRSDEERRLQELRARELERLESLGAIAGGLAHELNNLLTGIMGSAELVLDTLPQRDGARRSLERIVEAGGRAARLCDDMLAAAGPGAFEVRRLHLSDVVGGVLRKLLPSAPAQIVVEQRLAADLAPVAADSAQVERVFECIFANACEALERSGGTVIVATGATRLSAAELLTLAFSGGVAPGEFAWFEVVDDGPGLDAVTRAHAFDPFFSTKFAGRGLGLSAAARIVRSHKGAIEVHSERGSGARVRVFFPVCGDELR